MAESKHADLLNSLDQMSQSLQYAVRRGVLQEAERVIVAQEQEINALKEELKNITR